MSTPQEVVQRRQRILEYWRDHGATATAQEFGITRDRVYKILELVRFGCTKNSDMRTPRPIPVARKMKLMQAWADKQKARQA